VALTDEQILQQINVLTKKTSENPDMTYRSNASLNKGLNPEYFTNNSTKIVNAINDLAAANDNIKTLANDVSNKVNSILLDTDLYDNALIWDETKALMGKDTIIEGINAILKGDFQNKILNFTIDDAGKVLTVGMDDEGKPTTVAQTIESIVNVENLQYSNSKETSITNVKDALDYLFETSNSTVVNEVDWNAIKNVPDLGSKLALNDSKLCLTDEKGKVISEVEIITNEDIENIINNM
jgi:Tfp pilus assembly pilus retraction ATPase PilT